jgi:hypothetical protein
MDEWKSSVMKEGTPFSESQYSLKYISKSSGEY